MMLRVVLLLFAFAAVGFTAYPKLDIAPPGTVLDNRLQAIAVRLTRLEMRIAR